MVLIASSLSLESRLAFFDKPFMIRRSKLKTRAFLEPEKLELVTPSRPDGEEAKMNSNKVSFTNHGPFRLSALVFVLILQSSLTAQAQNLRWAKRAGGTSSD